ncbi:8-oxoguanine DNA glycosylase [Photobacterium ganghwense]|uniref:8-oxoguanine DNA glycosylase n=1 Tax=Photobacterium ganghwense TaxID=320778 RepID=UPI001A8BFC1D|nr:8-oxoguanine DNA glycosylase [Photobacterium ganghwense]QSV13781.1 8-oxoguanine DNA glycosylase [Photobacterium ganghwense]
MNQILTYWVDDQEFSVEIPNASKEVVKGVHWGDHCKLFTPAFWFSQFIMNSHFEENTKPYSSKGNLNEEIVFCMLGGFGVTVELATSAFNACKSSGLIEMLETDEETWLRVLSEPLMVNKRQQRYRYPVQKARYLANAMSYIRSNDLSNASGRQLRDKLLNIKGIGAKTAGWIARNHTDTDEVAILDIHILRAGVICGLFNDSQKVEKDYFEMESSFIEFCQKLGVSPASFDCFLWDQMRLFGKVALDTYKEISAS